MEPVSVFINGHEHCENGYKVCSVQLSKGCCEVHNLTSFTERNLADEVTIPSYLLRLEGRNVVPIAVTTVGGRWIENVAAEISPLAHEETSSSEPGVLPSGASKEHECDNPPAKPCETSEMPPSADSVPPCETVNADGTLPKPDIMPSPEQHENHGAEPCSATDNGEEPRKRFLGIF